MNPRNPTTGFTLLEVLVGLTLFSLIALSIYWALGSGSRSWQLGQTETRATEDFQLLAGFIRSRMSGAVPLVTVSAGERSAVNFNGTASEVQFVAEIASYVGLGGLYEMSLGLEDFGENRRLVVSRRLLHPDADETSLDEVLSAESTLVEGVKALEIEYFGGPRGRDSRHWRSRWSDADRLPELVRVRIVLHEERQWPDIVVRIRAGHSPQDRRGTALNAALDAGLGPLPARAPPT